MESKIYVIAGAGAAAETDGFDMPTQFDQRNETHLDEGTKLDETERCVIWPFCGCVISGRFDQTGLTCNSVTDILRLKNEGPIR